MGSKRKNQHAFEQNIIAMVWDYDKTLIDGYMQAPLFDKFGVDPKQFWDEVSALESHYLKSGILVNRDTVYLNHVLTYVQQGKFAGLNNQMLAELGAELPFYPGLPEFFTEIKAEVRKDPTFRNFGIRVEHYIVSTGFAAMIRGSGIASYVDGIWGCEFIENPALPGFLQTPPGEEEPKGVITQIGSALDNTSKTRYLFEVNKGANKVPEIDVNSRMDTNDRRVPFPQMIYIADGPSDVPAFSILKLFGGHTYAIYPRNDRNAFHQVDQLRKDGRIDMYGEADYCKGSQTYMWLSEKVLEIAADIVREKEDLIRSSVSAPPRHL